MGAATNGDLNNTSAERVRAEVATDPAYHHTSLAIPACTDEASVRQTYRPFLLDDAHSDRDWIARLELSTTLKMVDLQVIKTGGDRPKVLVLYGSMRERYILYRLCYSSFCMWNETNHTQVLLTSTRI
jgi:arsenic resistance protein ArsH